MRKWFVAWILVGAMAHFDAVADVQVHVEPRLVDELDSITLRLRVTGATTAPAPDLSVLQDEFEILGPPQTSAQRISVNGTTRAWVDYQYTLRAKRSGEIRIPSIQVGDQKSAPTSVIVRALDPSVKRSIDRMVFFETEMTADPVYVQAQTVFVRRLYYASGVQLYSDLPGVPKVNNAVIVPLGDTQSSTAIIDGTRYGVIEQRFAIFPEQSGRLTIPEAAITSSVRLRRNGRTRRSGIRITAPEQTVTVLPIPSEYPAGVGWLPATHVRLEENWTPDELNFDLGDPITRRLSVTAQGNTGSAIPPLQVEFPTPALKAYRKSPQLDDDATGHHVVGTRTESFSLMPTRPGQVTVPPVTLTWWDTQAHAVRTARLPGRSLVLHGTVPSSETRPSIGQPEPGQASERPLVEAPGLRLPIGPALATAALALLLGWLVWQLRRQPLPNKPKRSRREALRALKRACGAGNLPAMRRALIATIEVIYGGPEAQVLPRYLADPARAALWRELNAALYAPAGPPPRKSLARDLWRATRSLRRPRPRSRSYSLPALYPGRIDSAHAPARR